ncbi:MAG: hypothetical protein VYB72_04015 [Planctomycetota bacterium]|nr:hypothetical protein [Planctomycetota bacterium]
MNSRRVPEVAYLICCFETQIYTWELPSFKQDTGTDLPSDHSLQVGPCCISFSVEHTEEHQPTNLKQSFQIQIEVHGKSESLEKQLNERVCLLSETSDDLEPSPLHPATHAAINEDRSLWIIDLAPRKMRRSERCHRLTAIHNELTLENLRLTVKSIAPSFDPEEKFGSQLALEADGERDTLHPGPTNHAASEQHRSELPLSHLQPDLISPSIPDQHYPEQDSSEQDSSEQDSSEQDSSELEESGDVLAQLYESDDLLGDNVETQPTPSSIPDLDAEAVPESLLKDLVEQPLLADSPKQESEKENDFSDRDRGETQTDLTPEMSSNNTPIDQWFKTLAAEINPTRDGTEPAMQRVEEATSYPPASAKQNNPIADNETLTPATVGESSTSRKGPDNPNNPYNLHHLPEESQAEAHSIRKEDHDEKLDLHCEPEPPISATDAVAQSMLAPFQLTADDTSDQAQPMSSFESATPAEYTEETGKAVTFTNTQDSQSNPQEEETSLLGQGDENAAANGSKNTAPDPSQPAKTDSSQVGPEWRDPPTDMSSLSYCDDPTEQEDWTDEELEQLVSAPQKPGEQEKLARITPKPEKSTNDEPLNPVPRNPQPSDSVASHVRSLSDYKVDPDELTTEISVRLARHVASKRGIFSLIRKLAIVSLIVAVHIAVFYIVGTRIYGLLYGPE